MFSEVLFPSWPWKRVIWNTETRPLPVDSPRALVRLDVHLVQVDIDLGDLHLEAVGQQLDGLPHGAIARPPRHGEQGLGPNGS